MYNGTYAQNVYAALSNGNTAAPFCVSVVNISVTDQSNNTQSLVFTPCWTDQYATWGVSRQSGFDFPVAPGQVNLTFSEATTALPDTNFNVSVQW